MNNINLVWLTARQVFLYQAYFTAYYMAPLTDRLPSTLSLLTPQPKLIWFLSILQRLAWLAWLNLQFMRVNTLPKNVTRCLCLVLVFNLPSSYRIWRAYYQNMRALSVFYGTTTQPQKTRQFALRLPLYITSCCDETRRKSRHCAFLDFV